MGRGDLPSAFPPKIGRKARLSVTPAARLACIQTQMTQRFAFETDFRRYCRPPARWRPGRDLVALWALSGGWRAVSGRLWSA